MLEKLKYENHFNETYDFGVDGIYVNYNDLHNYAWNVTSKNNKISDISFSVTKKKMPVVVLCASEAEGIAAVNRLLEVSEKDVMVMQPGKIILNGYYFTCYITGSSKKKYLINKRYMEIELTIQSDYPYWIKETTTRFRNEPEPGVQTFLDYNYDYNYDFFNGMLRKTLNNSNFVESNFRMLINGPCVNPSILVHGHNYQVNVEVEENEYLLIDSKDKTIILKQIDGTEVNVFDNRDRDSYIFEKIPVGESAVSWNGEFEFDITVQEERAEPKWI